MAEPHAEDVRRRLEPPDDRLCDHPDCRAAALHPAPQSPDTLGEYYWFCRDHVREYNRGWDFFDGMDAMEIEAWRREDIVGHRPTWRMGGATANALGTTPPDEAFGLFDDERGWAAKRNGRARARSDNLPPDAVRALEALDLLWPVDWQTVKLRYRALAKQLHPDTNGGGEPAAEDRLKTVNRAYAILKSILGEGSGVVL